MDEDRKEEKKEDRIELFNKIKILWKDKRLKKDNFLIMILLGILLLVIVWPVEDSSQKEETSGKTEAESGIWDTKGDTISSYSNSEVGNEAEEYGKEGLEAYARYQEKRLEEVISVMEGAGKVKVMITLDSSGESIVEKDIASKRSGVTEVDSEGGSRNSSDIDTEQETIYVTDKEGNNIPYVKKTTQPVIGGVLVAVQGGNDAKIIQNITDAIKALFGIEVHKIKIVKMIS